ncbi:LuxR C-terminal-related transcriptional regulator [Ktedonobacter racemifer]|uniref:ATP-dependent transcriptional regulator, MalT-like, LuxR family n=1 Tax=Ktedonobacter racemifer DSM 44963 TaxID=485913 RepID=D6TUF4_KTERA|nr:LuxR C-terminal-related transcriptional regulator [Ktedonobacter racemifer]EFH84022.1 ATP-dependent transcriptional regulator, MalT-like, LuxR family [Ktedonobacter racemifer DSM 44963]
MPKSPTHALTWSSENNTYILHTPENPPQLLVPGEEKRWLGWLSTHTSFTFQGQHGHMSMLKEGRSRGSGYWYAYHTVANHTRKRYIGRGANLTSARLEEVARALNSEQVPVTPTPIPPPPETGQMLQLVETRLSHPRLPALLVTRERLLDKLDTALSYPLTLISASAGWGKTTLLSAWVARSTCSIAWLSLDELDNDPARFWISILAALRTSLPRSGKTVLAMLRAAQPPPLTTILMTLLNELSALAEPIVLVLDDYHVIGEQSVHDTFLYLLEHLPADVHLVIASRVDPPFPLARLRVRNQLLELRDVDLRFQTEEAAHFLTHTMALSLEETAIATLASRTEGWIAGLQLAALSMRHHVDPSTFVQTFSGGHRHLLHYIQEEILVGQPQALQAFLLHTSILNQMTASLCQAVTAQANSRELLEAGVRANLFLVPLDEELRWYRVHALFREALLARLRATQPEMVPLLQQRAARWHEQHGDMREAIVYALQAADYTYAASLMERVADQMWLRGEAQTLHTWIMGLPEAVLQVHAALALSSALHLLRNTLYMADNHRAKMRLQVEQTISAVEQMLQRSQQDLLTERERIRLSNRIRLLRGWQAMRDVYQEGDGERLHALSQEMQELVKDDELAWKLPPTVSMVLSHHLLGDFAPLVPSLHKTKALAQQAQDSYMLIKMMQWLANAYMVTGHMHLSHQECLNALELLDQMEGQMTTRGYLHLTLIELHLVWNNLAEAQTHLHHLLQNARSWQNLDLFMLGYYSQVMVSIAMGDLAEAEQALQESEALLGRNKLEIHRVKVTAARVDLWLTQGNLTATRAWTSAYVFEPGALENNDEWEHMALVRAYIAQKQYSEAQHVLEHLLANAEQDQRAWDIIPLLALQVAALHGSGDLSQARQIAARLLMLTESEGHIRPYLDAGEAMEQVLQSFLDDTTGMEDTANAFPTLSISHVSLLLQSFKEEKTRRARKKMEQASQVEPTHMLTPGDKPLSQVLLEPLTTQEQRVLRLLIAGQTYAEMAETLIVSRNTIKTHVTSIYRKLGVNRRLDAIVLAQRLHLH